MSARAEAQAIGDDIDAHQGEHEHNGGPKTPIAMGTLPIVVASMDVIRGLIP